MADDLALVVSELVTNAVVHGRAGAGREVAVSYRLNSSRLHVEVRDPADGIPTHKGVPDAEEEHGRGLLVVDMFTDRWGFIPRVIGKSVWCEFSVTTSPHSSDTCSAIGGGA